MSFLLIPYCLLLDRVVVIFESYLCKLWMFKHMFNPSPKKPGFIHKMRIMMYINVLDLLESIVYLHLASCFIIKHPLGNVSVV